MKKTLRNIALAAGIMGASVLTSPSPALAGDTGNLQRSGNTTTVQQSEGTPTPPAAEVPPATEAPPAAEAPPADEVAAVNHAPVWAEGLGTYTLTDAPVTFDLKASDADNDELVYVLPENWSQTPIEGGITVTYNGERDALGDQVSFTVSDKVNEPVGLDVVLSSPVVEDPVPTPEPYALPTGFRLGAEYNFLTVEDGAQYNLVGVRAAYDFPLNENILFSLNASAGYANEGEIRNMSSNSTDEVLVDSETGMQNLGDGQYLNWSGATYESSETSRTWEEGRDGGYVSLGAGFEFGRQVRFVTGLEGRVMFGSFEDNATDVTTTTQRQELTSYISENGQPITDVNVDTTSESTITQSNSVHGNNVYGTVAIPLGVSADLGNFNLSAGVAGGLMFNDGAQPYFGAGANITYRFGKKE